VSHTSVSWLWTPDILPPQEQLLKVKRERRREVEGKRLKKEDRRSKGEW